MNVCLLNGFNMLVTFVYHYHYSSDKVAKKTQPGEFLDFGFF